MQREKRWRAPGGRHSRQTTGRPPALKPDAATALSSPRPLRTPWHIPVLAWDRDLLAGNGRDVACPVLSGLLTLPLVSGWLPAAFASGALDSKNLERAFHCLRRLGVNHLVQNLALDLPQAPDASLPKTTARLSVVTQFGSRFKTFGP